MRPQTIQIFLPDGDPRGVKIAEITSRTVEALLIPRSQLERGLKREELGKVGIYLLFGEDQEGNAAVYIGEAEDCGHRLKQHHKDPKKDFWTHAVIVVSKTNFFTKSHVKYLELHAYKEALTAGRFKLLNGSVPAQAHVSEPVVADLLDNFDTAKVLISTLGYNVFDKMSKASKKDILYCSGKDASATGDYTEDGFVVLKGSKFQKDTTKGAHSWILDLRNKLIHSEKLVESDGVYVLQADHLFKSPSAAAASVLGRAANGWTSWKFKDGRTLDEVYRKGDEEK